MTTPKPPTLAMWTAIDADAKQPFQELAEEFRRLAAEAEEQRIYHRHDAGWRAHYASRRDSFTQAAQMLEERLNG